MLCFGGGPLLCFGGLQIFFWCGSENRDLAMSIFGLVWSGFTLLAHRRRRPFVAVSRREQMLPLGGGPLFSCGMGVEVKYG